MVVPLHLCGSEAEKTPESEGEKVSGMSQWGNTCGIRLEVDMKPKNTDLHDIPTDNTVRSRSPKIRELCCLVLLKSHYRRLNT